MTQRDFIEFACNLKHYVSLKLNFIESNEETPVAMLGDIIIHFNHADSEEQAEQECQRRKARINYDNIYIIILDRDIYSEDDYQKILKANFKNVAVVTSRKLNLPYAYYIKPEKNVKNQTYLDMNAFGIRRYERHWDYVKWLNSTYNHKELSHH